MARGWHLYWVESESKYEVRNAHDQCIMILPDDTKLAMEIIGIQNNIKKFEKDIDLAEYGIKQCEDMWNFYKGKYSGE